MSSSNRRNKAAIDQFRKELMAMVDDIQQIDKKVLNKAVNNGVAYAKRHTTVGKHPNPVTFTVKNGPDAGTVVSFKVSNLLELRPSHRNEKRRSNKRFCKRYVRAGKNQGIHREATGEGVRERSKGGAEQA